MCVESKSWKGENIHKMRISSYKLTVSMSYLASLSLVLLTIQLLVDISSVRETNYSNKTSNDSFITSDLIQDGFRSIHYSPLPLTNNSWTLYDIRMGARRGAPQQIGVSADTELSISDQDIRISSANRTVESNVLIYNRVPKCASTSMQGILRHLAKKNAFLFESSSIYWRWDDLILGKIILIMSPVRYYVQQRKKSYSQDWSDMNQNMSLTDISTFSIRTISLIPRWIYVGSAKCFLCLMLPKS